MATKKTSEFDKVHSRVTKIAGFISAILVIGGAVVGVGNWMTQQVSNVVAAQISDFREEVKESDASQNQAITRLELTNLIQNDPENIVAIEKMGRYYFGKLDGDQYMTAMFSKWAKTYGGDPNIVLGES